MSNYIIATLERIVRSLSRSRIEPHVTQINDRQGNSSWQIYDPVSGANYSLNSEREVRDWLDTRYYNG